MAPPRLPRTEEQRLQSLRNYAVMDTPPEEALDDLTRLAAHICGTPTAYISLLDADRQWFKSKVGIGITSTPRDISFCTHTLRQPGLMIVPDAAKDARFAESPLVTGEPRIRFYAGAPLINPEGDALGTLCVVDQTPHEMTPAQEEALLVLSRQVMMQLELRHQGRALRARENTLRAIFEGGPDCVQLLSPDGTVHEINPAGLRLLEAGSLHDLPHQNFLEVVPREDREGVRAMLEAVADNQPTTLQHRITGLKGSFRWVELSGVPFPDEASGRTYVLGVSHDITTRKMAEEKIHRLNRLYAVSSSVNEAIVRSGNKTQLYERACRIAVEEGGLEMAWVGLAVPGQEALNPVAHWGHNEGYLEAIKVTTDASRLTGKGPGGVAFRTGEPAWCNDIAADTGNFAPRAEALQRGYRSCAGFPLKIEGHSVGVLLVYSKVPGYFNEGEIDLLNALARNISFGMESLRRERRRLEIQSELRDSVQRYRSIVEVSPDAIFINRKNRIEYINPAGLKLLRALGPSQIVGRSPMDFFAPEFHAVIASRIAYLLKKPGTTTPLEKRMIALDGSVLNVEVSEASYQAGGELLIQVICRDISERKDAEADLRRSGDLMKAVVDGTPDAVFVKDLDGRYLMLNEAAAGFVGRPVAEIIGQTDEKLFGGDGAAIIHRNDQAVIRGGKVQITEEVLTAAGVTRTYQATKAPYRDSAGKVVGLIGISRDITGSKQAEEKIRTSEEQLRMVTENARVGLVMISPERRYIYANTAYSEILALPPGELKGQRVEDLLGSVYQDQISPRLDRAFAGERISYELHRPTAAGERHYAVRYEPTERDHQPPLVVVVITEITDLKFAENARLASDLRYRSLFEYATDGILIADGEGRYLDGNASICRMLGYPLEEFIGLDATHIVEKDETEYIGPAMEAILTKGEYSREWRFRRKDGSTFHAEVIATKMPDGLVLAMVRDITSRKQSETALHEAGRFAQSTIDALSAQLCVLDENGNILAVNAAWKRFGRENASPFPPVNAATNYLTVCDKAYGEEQAEANAFAAGIRLVTSGGQQEYLQEYPCHCPIDRRWFAARVTRFPGTGPTRVVVVHENITQRKLAEEALLENATMLLEAQSLAKLGHWTWDMTTGLHRWSHEIFMMYGRDPELGAAGVPEVAQYFTPESWANLNAAIGSALARQESYQCDAEVVRPDGTRRWITARGAMTRDSHDKVTGMHGTVQDITDRQRTEERMRRLVESNIQGVFFWKTNGLITEANDAFLTMSGYSREELAAGLLNWQRMTPAEFLEADSIAMRGVRITGVVDPYEKEFYRKDGTRLPVLVGSASFKDDPDEGLCFALDLRERRKLEQQFLRSQRMESIGNLAGGIAHDLNNALAPIMMSLDLLKMRFTDPESMELLEMISSSAQRGADMVRQVLSFARGVEGRRIKVAIHPLVKEIEKITNETFLKHITVRTVLPEPDDLWTVLGDPTQLHQVLLNLCVNARDAMPEGGILTLSATNTVMVPDGANLKASSESAPCVLIQVEDTGTGMPPEVIEKIFDPFFTTKEMGKGTGLGLSTSISIVKSHGGFIRVSSEPGRGTTFQVYLPAEDGPPDGTSGPVHEADLPPGNGELILVIDDELSVREITRRALEAYGYRVVMAGDGAEGIGIFANRRLEIDAVLVDMMMPVVDGPATIRVLQAIVPGFPIIAASGITDQHCRAKAASLGVTCLLSKPYTAQTLLNALHQILHTPGTIPGKGP